MGGDCGLLAGVLDSLFSSRVVGHESPSTFHEVLFRTISHWASLLPDGSVMQAIWPTSNFDPFALQVQLGPAIAGRVEKAIVAAVNAVMKGLME